MLKVARPLDKIWGHVEKHDAFLVVCVEGPPSSFPPYPIETSCACESGLIGQNMGYNVVRFYRIHTNASLVLGLKWILAGSKSIEKSVKGINIISFCTY